MVMFIDRDEFAILLFMIGIEGGLIASIKLNHSMYE